MTGGMLILAAALAVLAVAVLSVDWRRPGG
jgi:hypothetical protein